jgi:hypothetical protein
MATTTLPTSGNSTGKDHERPLPPCPVCGERVVTVEDRGTGLVVMRPCGCAA